MRRVLRSWLFAQVMLFCACSPAAASGPSFAEMVAKQIRGQLPGYDLTIVDQLTIRVKRSDRPDEDSMQINLDRVAAYCDRVPDRCDKTVSDFVSRIIDVVTARDIAPTAANLRAVVRRADYVAGLVRTLGKKGGELISAPFAGDLVMMCYFDRPTAMQAALTSDLAKIALTRESALEVCRENMRGALPPLPTSAAARGPATSEAARIGVLKGDPYESSYVLFHDDWAPLAATFGGHLLVAAPDADLILYAPDAGRASRDAISKAAKKAYDVAERSISTNVFRWTPAGWEVAVP